MEKQLIKLLLNHKFFSENSHLVSDDFFVGDLLVLWGVVKDAHRKYKADLKLEWVKAIHKTKHPALTNIARRNLAILFDDIKNEEDVLPELAIDLIKDMSRKQTAQEIAQAALEVFNGEKDDLTEVKSLLQKIDEVNSENTIFEEVPFDLDNLLETMSPEGLFPFRHPALCEHVPGAAPGDFIILFARPEAGKTSFMCYETAGHLKHKRKVGYFANEEKATKIYLRVVCSFFEKTVGEIRESTKDVQTKFKKYIDYLQMISCVGMDIAQVDDWCRHNKPDVLILDQLDKFSVYGEYSRGDERLGALYCQAREIGKRHDCLVYGVSQCSAEGEGASTLSFSMLANSKTSKAAEADLIIGIGQSSLLPSDMNRQFHVSKNKINGFHGSVGAILDQYKATYRV